MSTIKLEGIRLRRIRAPMARGVWSALLLVAASWTTSGQEVRVGYSDTPLLPGSRWHVHDGARPRPRVVDPGSAGKPQAVPGDAVPLFRGGDLARWKGQKGEARWKVSAGHMEVNGTGSIQTRAAFGDCQLHLEWATPREVRGSSQGRGNSGVFLMGRYEIQVLDSYHNVTYADGQAAAIYGQFPPLVNACRPPGAWQTYDIIFRAPRFAGQKLAAPARVTVIHNGILVQDQQAFLGPTRHRQLAHYAPHPGTAPLLLQDHGNPVRYRNIWIRPLRSK